jgi:hypothetical protein
MTEVKYGKYTISLLYEWCRVTSIVVMFKFVSFYSHQGRLSQSCIPPPVEYFPHEGSITNFDPSIQPSFSLHIHSSFRPQF